MATKQSHFDVRCSLSGAFGSIASSRNWVCSVAQRFENLTVMFHFFFGGGGWFESVDMNLWCIFCFGCCIRLFSSVRCSLHRATPQTDRNVMFIIFSLIVVFVDHELITCNTVRISANPIFSRVHSVSNKTQGIFCNCHNTLHLCA